MRVGMFICAFPQVPRNVLGASEGLHKMKTKTHVK